MINALLQRQAYKMYKHLRKEMPSLNTDVLMIKTATTERVDVQTEYEQIFTRSFKDENGQNTVDKLKPFENFLLMTVTPKPDNEQEPMAMVLSGLGMNERGDTLEATYVLLDKNPVSFLIQMQINQFPKMFVNHQVLKWPNRWKEICGEESNDTEIVAYKALLTHFLIDINFLRNYVEGKHKGKVDLKDWDGNRHKAMKGRVLGDSEVIVSVKLNSSKYLDYKPPTEPSGIRKREHPVVLHYRSKEGKAREPCGFFWNREHIWEKQDQLRFRHPHEVCKCGAERWVVYSHKRGDSSLGVIRRVEEQPLID